MQAQCSRTQFRPQQSNLRFVRARSCVRMPLVVGCPPFQARFGCVMNHCLLLLSEWPRPNPSLHLTFASRLRRRWAAGELKRLKTRHVHALGPNETATQHMNHSNVAGPT